MVIGALIIFSPYAYPVIKLKEHQLRITVEGNSKISQSDIPRLRGALDAIRATLSLVGTEYEPDAKELHRQIAFIVDAALAYNSEQPLEKFDMPVATDKVNELRDLAQEIVDAADELITIREAERGEYDAEDRQTALDDFENTIRNFFNTIPQSLMK